MSEVEFKPWPKIGRESPFKVTITEKMDGTNACIVIKDGEVVGVQSRKRFITPEDDNHGFAKWVSDNNDDLLSLGDGYHYGEWAGIGIQKNPHGLDEKRFFLFNTFRWNKDNPNRPKCCDVVPVLFEGKLATETVDTLLHDLQKNATPEQNPEGIIVYYHAFRNYTKHTIVAPNGKWAQ